MPSPAENFLANLRDVFSLFELHAKHTGSQRGRRHGVEVLNKSALALTTACWEAFVEDIAVHGARFIGRKLVPSEKLPILVQRRLCDRVRGDKHELAPWALAGRGWRAIYQEHVAGEVERFNTPKVRQVDDLLERTLGCPKISDSWSWKGMAPEGARVKLDSLVTLRGSVVHRVSAGSPVHKAAASDYVRFVQRLAICTNNATRTHIKGIVGKFPWTSLHVADEAG